MKNLNYNCLLLFSCLSLISSAQCSFQYISNDTIFQDYIEFIYPRKSSDEIITIGSRINRGIINDSVFNSPVFQTFDYCGNILKKVVYKYIGNCKLRHGRIPTHNTFKDEPIGNTAIRIKDDEFLIVDKGYDTLSKEFVMIQFIINEKGELKSYKTLSLNNQETNQTTIKNVLQLKNGNLLIILWDYADEYLFYYFDENSDFLCKKSFNLGRGIRAIKEIDNNEFICTSLAYDNSSFQFYKLDTSGEIKWIVNPFNEFGSAREILIENNKIYVTGGVSFGVFLICDMDGTILKEFKFDTFFCKSKFCSAYFASDISFIIGGYVQHCESTDSSGSDVAILRIDTNGTILWNKLYDFRNSLGTSDSDGHFNDYGGFVIVNANDGGVITNGMSRYNRSISGGVLNEDALLIKTEPRIITNTYKQINIGNLKFELLPNLINDNLNIDGPMDLITNWFVYSSIGEVVIHGKEWPGLLNVRDIESGIYAIQLIDRNNFQYLYKFVKI